MRTTQRRKIESYIVSFGKLIGATLSVAPYKVYVNWRSGDSFYTPDRRIQIGLGDYKSLNPEIIKKCATALVAHEVSHHLHSKWETFDRIRETVEGLPFSLLNVIEDQRIETLINRLYPLEEEFIVLHSLDFEQYYEGVEDEEIFFNPVNLLVLLRWSLWSDQLKERIYKKLGEFSLSQFISSYYPDRGWEDFERDGLELLQTVQEIEDIDETVEPIIRFYRRWEALFHSPATGRIIVPRGGEGEDGAPVECPSPKTAEEKLSEGDGRDREEKEETTLRPHNNSLIGDGEWEDYFDDSPLFEWDDGEIERVKLYLSRWRERGEVEVRDYSMTSGRRVVPRRIVQRKTTILRKKEVRRKERPIKDIIFVLDGSGSMYGFPHRAGSHLIRAIWEVLGGVETYITNSGCSTPLKIKTPDTLRYYDGGRNEGLRTLEKVLSPKKLRNSLIIFFTDGFVCKEDREFLKKIRNKVSLYVGKPENLPDVEENFQEWGGPYLTAPSLEELAKKLLFILKNKAGRG